MRLLLLILLALPLCAQYPAGAVFQRGDDPLWADPGFDDRQWVKQSDYRANSYNDYLQNRSWMRARVAIPAGEPAVIVSQNCPCEFFVNGLRIGATGDLDQALALYATRCPLLSSPGRPSAGLGRLCRAALRSARYGWRRFHLEAFLRAAAPRQPCGSGRRARSAAARVSTSPVS